MSQNQTEVFLELAQEPYRSECRRLLNENKDWQALQQRFLEQIDDDLAAERAKPLDMNISSHEAGGQFRIAFPHLMVRGGNETAEYMKNLMKARKRFTDEHYFHGYVDCHEVHHEIETYLYFQQPLYYLGFAGADTAAGSILHLAEHTGSWVKEVPAWYDWETHSFVSTFLGTRGVKDFPPYDYQEGNHFRFTDAAMAAYKITGESRYLKLLEDYAARWCDHIEKLAAGGKPIPCSILPESAEMEELDHAGIVKEENGKYKIFYHEVAANTMYDIAGALMDLWRLTANRRYLAAAEAMMDQFYANGKDGKPANTYSGGEWRVIEDVPSERGGIWDHSGYSGLLARVSLRHIILTGSDKYKEKILAWAATVDEESQKRVQLLVPLMAAAHFLSGDKRYLERAYRMALRYHAAVEHDDHFHQCNATARQGSKYQLDLLYSAMLGGVDWATRGNLPVTLLRHTTGGETGLPEGISFRVWRAAPGRYSWEAFNTGNTAASWELRRAADGSLVEAVTLAPGQGKTGECAAEPAMK
jgi:hypothetical protein